LQRSTIGAAKSHTCKETKENAGAWHRHHRSWHEQPHWRGARQRTEDRDYIFFLLCFLCIFAGAAGTMVAAYGLAKAFRNVVVFGLRSCAAAGTDDDMPASAANSATAANGAILRILFPQVY
jgi:hypothetical protein